MNNLSKIALYVLVAALISFGSFKYGQTTVSAKTPVETVVVKEVEKEVVKEVQLPCTPAAIAEKLAIVGLSIDDLKAALGV